MRGMRTAVVDIGTNSTRLLIADLDDGRVTGVVERRTTITRLGAGVDADGRLSEEAMDRVYRALEEYRKLIDRDGAQSAVAVLTSAVRDAANGAEFARTVEDRYGLAPHILSGDDEAHLTFLGATSERDPDDPTPTLVIDIGGGSTELVIGAGREMAFHVSNQAGVVRQTERFIGSDPPTRPELEALAGDVGKILAGNVPDEQRHPGMHAIAVAGTATSLAAIDEALEPYDPEKVQGYALSEAACQRILQRLAALTLEQRRHVAGLHPDRAPTIVAGAVILLEVMKLFGLGAVEVSEHDILRGAALGLNRAA
jgi:exopolyphosphatase/guanosine-5'-triphosphate,3'-diphosphate pyrophosphatase